MHLIRLFTSCNNETYGSKQRPKFFYIAGKVTSIQRYRVIVECLGNTAWESGGISIETKQRPTVLLCCQQSGMTMKPRQYTNGLTRTEPLPPVFSVQNPENQEARLKYWPQLTYLLSTQCWWTTNSDGLRQKQNQPRQQFCFECQLTTLQRSFQMSLRANVNFEKLNFSSN